MSTTGSYDFLTEPFSRRSENSSRLGPSGLTAVVTARSSSSLRSASSLRGSSLQSLQLGASDGTHGTGYFWSRLGPSGFDSVDWPRGPAHSRHRHRCGEPRLPDGAGDRGAQPHAGVLRDGQGGGEERP